MNTYYIPAENMDALNKKLARVERKCAKHNCTYSYEIIGSEMRKQKDGTAIEYIQINVEGIAVINGWTYVGRIEHTPYGNNIHHYNLDIAVPDRYKTMCPYCNHCNSKRQRKDTYLVYNVDTGAYKQLGRSCLREYTSGLSAEMVACYMSYISEIEDAREITGAPRKYYNVRTYLAYVKYMVDQYGYCKADRSSGEPTYSRAFDALDNANIDLYNKVMADDHLRSVDNALAWITNYDLSADDNDYMVKLHDHCRCEYIQYRYMGIVASLFSAHDNYLKRQAQLAIQAVQNAKTAHVGKVGDKITIDVKSFEIVTSWQTQWGTTHIYKIVDQADNVYTWKTGGYIPHETKTIKATIKDHSVYNGLKQTDLTRCKSYE